MMQRTVLREGAVSLREALPKARWIREGDIRFTSCAADWRVCRQGDIFFALTTADGDGHEDATLAVEKALRR